MKVVFSLLSFLMLTSLAHADVPKAQIICRGEIYKSNFSSGESRGGLVETGTNVELRVFFNLDKGRTVKSWAGIDVPTFKAVVEERLYAANESPNGVSPIMHKNVVLKVNTGDDMWFFRDLYLSLGLPSYSGPDHDAGYIVAGTDSSGYVTNKRQGDFDKNYRTAWLKCDFQLK